MNISIEYLTRTKIIRNLTTFPCSFFLTSKNNNVKIAICVYKLKDVYSIKRWNLHQCDFSHALPPMEEFEVLELFSDSKIIISEMNILKCKHFAIPAKENTPKKPMDNYNDYFDDYLTKFNLHREYKEKWLWNVFLNIHYPEMIVIGMSIKRSLRMYGDHAANEIMKHQKQIIEFQHPKLWKFWNMWYKHMLDFKGIPGEFIFASCFTGVPC